MDVNLIPYMLDLELFLSRLDFHHSLMSGVFSSLRREEGGGVRVPFLNGGWRLSLIFVTVPIYLGKREALHSEVRKSLYLSFLLLQMHC